MRDAQIRLSGMITTLSQRSVRAMDEKINRVRETLDQIEALWDKVTDEEGPHYRQEDMLDDLYAEGDELVSLAKSIYSKIEDE
jgi:alkanesulfonate monooxygenase SsuD/methylene tetrahydromethanopterin reductase-like flavin-dependent oxidoreductase (luciferase family)